MFEKVNPSHPDKLADRIAGAIVDLAYLQTKHPRIAVEVLLGHGVVNIIIESSTLIKRKDIIAISERILQTSDFKLNLLSRPQDKILARNQTKNFRCGDNGIFKGVPISEEEKKLSILSREIYAKFPTDGKYIIHDDKYIICQSNAEKLELERICPLSSIINPLGFWTGGPAVDSGATNRKLGSDMGRAVTGGGLHGKDLSKADVSVNIYAHLLAQKTGAPVELFCAIGDDYVNGMRFDAIVNIAEHYITEIGGFEKFAEWGLI